MGKTYFVKLFTNPESIKGNVLLAAIVSLILIFNYASINDYIFPKVRRKIQPKKWKKNFKGQPIYFMDLFMFI